MTSNDHLTAELAAELRSRADGLHAAPVSFEGVRGRARTIRRRRAAGTTGVVAAALALVLVVPSLLGALGMQRSERPQPAPPGHEQVQRPTVLHAGTFTLPDGTERDLGLRPGDVSQFGALADGRLVLANQARSRIEVYDGSALTATYDVDLLVLNVSTSGRLAAWTQGSRVQVLESGHPRPVALARMPVRAGTLPMVDAVTGRDCAGGGCRAIVSDGTRTTSVVSTTAVRDLPGAPAFRVTDVSPDGRTWAVAFPPRGQGQYGCAGLYDVAGAGVTGRTCAAASLEFSPDGRHLLGADFENNMTQRVTVLDRDLEPVLVYDAAPRAVSRLTWEDGAHLLAGLVDLDGSRWSLESIAIDDGSTATLDGPARGGNPEILSEYAFSE